jgi:hypothetical protein
VALAAPALPQQVANYTSHRAAGAIRIDGKLDEPDWRAAPRSNAFVDIVTGEAAWFDTRAALIWDRENLYVGFFVEEPDVQATLTARDSKIYLDNDVEVFIGGKDAYYEFELNAHNTVYEVFWIWKDILKPGSIFYGVPEFDPTRPGVATLTGIGGHIHPRGARWGFLDWDLPGLKTAVHIDGTLNNSADRDQGWTVEIAFPWKSLHWIADGRALPPREGDEWRIDCSRFQKYARDGAALKRSAGWTWNRHGHYDSHIPEVFPKVRFTEKPLPK